MKRDYSHHLSPPDGLAKPSLGPPRELCLCPAHDTTHIGYKVGEESRIEGLLERVDTKLVEDILSTGYFGRRTKIRTLEDAPFLCSVLHRKCSRGHRLSTMGKLPLQAHYAHAGNVLTWYGL